MPQLMLVNPAPRRRKAGAKKRRVGAKRARRVRRSNPLPVATARRRIRRASTGARRAVRRIRRRRNPISMRSLTSGGLMKMLKNAALGGAGAVSMDMVMAQVNKFLPPSLQPQASGLGIGANDAVRAILTVIAGRGLSKVTRGASETMAAGSLAVQAADIGRVLMAAHMPAVSGVGYRVPNPVLPGTARVSPPVGARGSMGVFTKNGGASPLLSAYTGRGMSPLLSGARNREMARR